MSTLLRAGALLAAEDRTVEGSLSSRNRDVLQPFCRFGSSQVWHSPESEELLVVDARARLTPAQMVEQKLVSLLKGKMLPMSHIRSAASSGKRR